MDLSKAIVNSFDIALSIFGVARITDENPLR